MLFLPVAPAPEQYKIANFLDTKCTEIDALTQDIQTQIDTLQQYKQSVITEAITKGLDPNVELKDSGIEWIGEIPAHWKISALKYLLAEPMKYGATESGIAYDEKLCRYIRITDIDSNGNLKESGKLSLSDQQSQGYILQDGTILFARSGATVGKSFLYKAEYGKAAFAGYLISAVANRKMIFPQWIWYYSSSSTYWKWANRIFNQATIQNISADKYSSLPITVPPLSEQEIILEYLDSKCAEIDDIIAEKNKQLDILADYKKSLIYEYVTGKKEVPSA